MPTFMVDTNTCIYAILRRSGDLVEPFVRHRESICIAAITLAEMRVGSEQSSRRESNLAELALFLADLDVLPFDSAAAEHFGEIKAHLFRAGKPVGPADMLIGAHARSRGLTLVTNNRREFDRIPALKVENWAA